MQSINISIETVNAAFQDNPEAEIADILRDLAKKLEGGDYHNPMVLHDSNGNKVGEVSIDHE